eukprot:UN07235
MGISIIAKWNIFQGMLMFMMAILAMTYPQFINMFMDESTVDLDYSIVQFTGVCVFFIAVIYIASGGGMESVWIKVLLNCITPQNKENIEPPRSSPVLFAVGTVVNRIIVVPIMAVIMLLTFGKSKEISILCYGLLIVDPPLGVATFFMVKKFAPILLLKKTPQRIGIDSDEMTVLRQ